MDGTAGIPNQGSSGGRELNLATALVVHLVAGLVWLVALYFVAREVGGELVATVWVASALGLGMLAAARMGRARARPGRVWWLSLLWWLESFVAPFAAGYELLQLRGAPAAPARPAPIAEEPAVNVSLLERLDAYERKLRALERELAELRRMARPEAAPTRPAPEAPRFAEPTVPPPPRVPPPPEVPPAQIPRPLPPRPAAPPPRPAAARPKPAPRAPSLWETLGARLRALETSDLLTASVMAWLGGIVTLLGIVFFFVLAVNRGWIGPEIRVACGGLASSIVFGAGLFLRRRYGDGYSPLAAVGAGLAGGYATLLAAAALYHLLPSWAALLVAAAVAAVGLVTSIRWSSEIVAGLGLIGAMLVPVVVVVQGGLTTTGTAFVAIVFAATAAVAVWQRWRQLLAVGGLVSLPQIAVLVGQAGAGGHTGVVALAAAFWLLYLGAGVAYQWRLAGAGLAAQPTTFVLVSVVFAALAAARLFDGAAQGTSLLVVAAVYGAIGAAFFARPRYREVSNLVTAAGLAVAAIGVATLLSGPSLAFVWAAEGALLAFLAWRAGETRFQVAALAYGGLTLGHALAFEARPDHLFAVTRHPAEGAPSLIGTVIAALVLAFYAREARARAPREQGVLRFLEGFFAAVRARQPLVRTVALWSAAVLSVYAAALGILAAFEAGSGSLRTSFEHGHVVVSAFLALVGLAVLAVGLRRRSAALVQGGLVWLALVFTKLVVFDLTQLGHTPRALSALAVGIALALAGFDFQRRESSGRLVAVSVAALGLGIGFTTWATVALAHGTWNGISLEGAALLGLAAGYGVLTVIAFPGRIQRDLASLLGATALALAAVAAAELLSGTWLVLAWAAGAAALAVLGAALREERLSFASLAFLGAALGHALWLDAPPSDLFLSARHPADGVPALLLVVAAAGVFARFVRLPYARPSAVWGASALTAYAASLSILEGFQLRGGSIETSFEYGHVVVSAFLALAGLAVLAAGLRRPSPALVQGGLVWLGVTLAKLCVFDLTELGHTPRGLSALAVGAAVALAGFDYQRRRREGGLDPLALGGLAASVALTSWATVELAHGTWNGISLEGAALLALAAGYGVLTAIAFPGRAQRDLASALGGTALTLAAVASAELLSGTWLVLAWTAAAALLVVLAHRLREERLALASLAYLAIGLGHTLLFEAPPSDLFLAGRHPGDGVPALLLVAAAGSVFARFARLPRVRAALWSAGVLAVYAASLAILELFETLGTADVHTSFQRGHSGVSALWGALGLALLYVGLVRGSRSLRLGGFALFGVSLGKLFLYDLANLNSITRALSFLAVGVVLLLGGFFYQRLSSQLAERRGTVR